MKFYLDTANLEEIKEVASMGILDGVTTNPSLISKEGKNPNKLLKEICEVVKGPVSAEVIATDYEKMVEEARALAEISPHIVIKCPITKDGMKATKILADEGFSVNATLCFSPMQALIAARAGAAYVSPFVGRLDDVSSDGMDLIHKIRVIFDNYNIKAQLLSASLRHPMHVVESALAGADIATMPYKVMMQCFEHPLTDAGLKKFLEDWGKVKK